MIAGVHACCRAFEDETLGEDDVNEIVEQFVTTCEYDYDVLAEVGKDEMFPNFVQHLLSCSYRCGGELATLIVQFLATVAAADPYLYDVIAANTDLSDFAFNHFSKYTETVDIEKVKATAIFPFVKFAAMVANSKRFNMTEPQSVNILVASAVALLNDAQLAAWAAAILAGLTRNSSVAEAYLRSLPNRLQVKRSLFGLRSSNDVCVVCASISTLTAMFLVKPDSCSDLQMLVQFVASESQFFLMPILAGDAVMDLIKKKTKLVREDLTKLLAAALTAKGMHAVAVFKLLVDLSEYHPLMAQIVRQTPYLGQLFQSLIAHEEDFVLPCGCQFLLQLSDCDQDLLVGMNKSDLFAIILEALVDSGPSRFESLAVLLCMLAFELKKTDVALLSQAEDFLFTAFLRAIEDNSCFLSLVMFRLLHKCAKYMKGWTIHIKRIVVDTQFPVLIANVLQESCERHVTRSALETLQYFITTNEPEFSDLFTSAFLMLGKRRQQEQTMTEDQHRVERMQTRRVIENLETLKRQHASELERMKEETHLATTYHDQTHRSEVKAEPRRASTDSSAGRIKPQASHVANLKEENTELQTKLAEQSAVITSQQNELENLREQNRRLLDKLEDLKCEIESRDQEKQVFEKQLQDAKAEEQTFALRDAESKLQLAQRTVLKLRKALEDTRNECMTGVEQNKRMQTEIGTMRALLEQQQAESQKLVADLDLLEGQNNQLRANQQNLNDIRRKYAAKREKLESQIREERKEKRQWESVARFDRIIRNGQLHTTQEAFNEIEGTPENPATLE